MSFFFRRFDDHTFSFSDRKRIQLSGQSLILAQHKLNAAKIKPQWSRFQIHLGKYHWPFFFTQIKLPISLWWLKSFNLFRQCGDKTSRLLATNFRRQRSSWLALCYKSIIGWTNPVIYFNSIPFRVINKSMSFCSGLKLSSGTQK